MPESVRAIYRISLIWTFYAFKAFHLLKYNHDVASAKRIDEKDFVPGSNTCTIAK